MNLMKKYEKKPDYNPVAGGEESTLKLLEFGILNLKTGDVFDSETGDREMSAIIFQGNAIS